MKYHFVLTMLFSLFSIPVFFAQDTNEVEIDVLSLTQSANVEAIGVGQNHHLVVAYNDLTVFLYDLENLQVINQHTIDNGDLFAQNGIQFSPDDSLYIVQTFYAVHIFDSKTGNLLNSIDISSEDVAFAPDSQSIYVLANDVITVYDLNSLTSTASVRVGEDGDGRFATDMVVLNDGTVVALIPDETFEYYVYNLPADLSSLTATEFIGRDLFAGTDSYTTVYYRNLNTIRANSSLAIDTSTACGDFTSIDYSPNGNYIAGAGINCGAYVFDAMTGAVLYELSQEGVIAVTMDNDTVYVATTSGIQTVTFPELMTDTVDTTITEDANQPESEPVDAETVDVISSSNYQLQYITNVAGDVDIAAVVAHPNGQQFAGISGFSNRIVTFDSATMTETARYEGVAGTGNITYTPDGAYLIATDSDKQVLVFDAQSLTLLHRVAQPIEFVVDITASNTTAYVIGQDEERQGFIFTVDVQSGTVSEPIQAFEGFAYIGFEYQPDDTLIGLGIDVSTQVIKTWDANLNVLSSVPTEQYWASALFADDILFSTEQRADGEIFVGYSVADAIDVQAEASLMADMLCRRPPVRLATTQDARLAVATNFQCPVYFFNVDSATLMQTLERDDVKDGAFSSDGQYLYLATKTGIDVYQIVVVE